MDINAFKENMSRHPSGITIITTLYKGQELGFTASSVVSASLNPPMVLFCIGKYLRSFDAFTQAEYYAVNFLAGNQENLAVTFASQGAEKFVQDNYFLEKTYRIPILKDTCGYLILQRKNIYDAGDHKIILGSVSEGTESLHYKSSLTYLNRKFIEIS